MRIKVDEKQFAEFKGMIEMVFGVLGQMSRQLSKILALMEKEEKK